MRCGGSSAIVSTSAAGLCGRLANEHTIPTPLIVAIAFGLHLATSLPRPDTKFTQDQPPPDDHDVDMSDLDDLEEDDALNVDGYPEDDYEDLYADDPDPEPPHNVGVAFPEPEPPTLSQCNQTTKTGSLLDTGLQLNQRVRQIEQAADPGCLADAGPAIDEPQDDPADPTFHPATLDDINFSLISISSDLQPLITVVSMLRRSTDSDTHPRDLQMSTIPTYYSLSRYTYRQRKPPYCIACLSHDLSHVLHSHNEL